MISILTAGDGRLGYPDDAPYDAIHVGAAAAVIPQPVSCNSSSNMSPYRIPCNSNSNRSPCRI